MRCSAGWVAGGCRSVPRRLTTCTAPWPSAVPWSARASGELKVTGMSATAIGDLAHALGVRVHHLAEVEQSLEHAYVSLTEESVDHHATYAEEATR